MRLVSFDLLSVDSDSVKRFNVVDEPHFTVIPRNFVRLNAWTDAL